MENRRLGEVIRQRRKIRGLTLGQVAIKVGVSAAAISKIERNLVDDPGINTITGIALALGCTPNDLLIDAGVLETPDPDTVWTPELLVMQRVLQHLENLDPEMRQDAGRVVIAQAHAWEQISKLQEPEPSENIQQDEDINETL